MAAFSLAIYSSEMSHSMADTFFSSWEREETPLMIEVTSSFWRSQMIATWAMGFSISSAMACTRL